MLPTLSFTSPMTASAQTLHERPSAEDRDVATTKRKGGGLGGLYTEKMPPVNIGMLELPPLTAAMATAARPVAPAVEKHQVWSLWAEFHAVIASLYEHMPGTSSKMHTQLKGSFFLAATTSKAALKVFLEQFVRAGRLRCVYVCMYPCLGTAVVRPTREACAVAALCRVS